MDVRKIILLVGALVIAGVTAFFARSMFIGAATPEASAAPVPQGPEVLVATRTLPVGTIIDAEALRYQIWPAGLVQPAYFIRGGQGGNPQDLMGTVVRTEISAGQPLTQGAIVAPATAASLPPRSGPGMRAITVGVSATSGVAGFVFPGDRVDLVLTQEVSGEGEGSPLKVSETVIRNIRVLATDQRINARDENGNQVAAPIATVTLEATPRIAEKIMVAQTIGQLSLSLRSLADSNTELERAIATGRSAGPADRQPEDERRMLIAIAGQPIDSGTTFSVGGDVSRFQRRSVPRKKPEPRPRRRPPIVRRRLSSSATHVPAPIQAAWSRSGRRCGWFAATMSPSFRWGVNKMHNVSKLRRARFALSAAAALGLALAAPVSPAAAQPQSNGYRPTQQVILSTGQGELVSLPREVANVWTSNAEVADIQVNSPRQIGLFGKANGEATVIATAADGSVVYGAQVRVSQNISSTEQVLRAAMPGTDISVAHVGQVAVINGTVSSPEESAQAELLVRTLLNPGHGPGRDDGPAGSAGQSPAGGDAAAGDAAGPHRRGEPLLHS
jgi:pilus assembly protein CpaB